MTPFLAIEIAWDPTVIAAGGVLLTWHGLLTAAGIGVGLSIGLALARRAGIGEEAAWMLAVAGVLGGLIGARLFFIAEHWSYFSDHLGEMARITEGGLSAWGGIVGGFGGALLVGWWRGYRVRAAFDAGAIGVTAGLAIGALGGVLSGEHFGGATDLPWGVVYTHPDSPAYAYSAVVGAHHPAAAYELTGSLLILALLAAVYRGPLRDREGMTFVAFLAAYALMRLGVSELRADAGWSALGLTAPQLIAMCALLVAAPLAPWFWRQPSTLHTTGALTGGEAASVEAGTGRRGQ